MPCPHRHSGIALPIGEMRRAAVVKEGATWRERNMDLIAGR